MAAVMVGGLSHGREWQEQAQTAADTLMRVGGQQRGLVREEGGLKEGPLWGDAADAAWEVAAAAAAAG